MVSRLKKFRKITTGLLSLPVALGFVLMGHTVSAAAATPSGHQFVADVNGDGFGDAVTFDAHAGDWWVALASGQAFQAPSRWISGFGVGSSKQFVANVGGGSGADLITFDATTGDWWVAISNNASGFQAPSRWAHGHGVGSANQLVGDINGDGRADAVVFFGNGSWWAATSNLGGTTFDPPGQWFSAGLGVGSTRQFLADVSGDGKADAVVWNDHTGDWWVSNSDGVHFATGPNRWAAGVGFGSTDQFLTDVSGDGKADAVFAFPAGSSRYGGQWWVATSSGSALNSATEWSNGFGYGVANIVFSNVYSTGNADMITFDANTGDWYVYPAGDGAFINAGVSRWISGFGVGT